MGKNILYFECYSGISGDMTVASLIDLGVNINYLKEALNSIPIDGYDIEISKVMKNGIKACDFNVIIDECKYSEKHIHRSLNDIYKIIDEAKITLKAKSLAKKIFHIVADAESEVHGIEIQEVHFHEVGAVDSIIDIVATAVCLDYLNIDAIIVSDIYEGIGYVRCQHGNLPVPVPAVTKVALKYKMPIKITRNEGEMVTPTGIAIAAAIKTTNNLPESYLINAIGIGAGKKEYVNANILRTYIIEEVEKQNNEDLWIIESNIDDCSGEALGYTMEKLFEIGVKDVFYIPIYMKKSRPAFMLKVICHKDLIYKVEDIIFRNTTTIGVRKYRVERQVLPRQIVSINTEYGDCRVKIAGKNEYTFFYPEYEDVKRLANNTGIDYLTMYSSIKKVAEEKEGIFNSITE